MRMSLMVIEISQAQVPLHVCVRIRRSYISIGPSCKLIAVNDIRLLHYHVPCPSTGHLEIED